MNAPLFEFQKFPRILFRGRTIVWDSRQAKSPEEWTIIPHDDYVGPDLAKLLELRSEHRISEIKKRDTDIVTSAPRSFLGEAAAAHFNFPSRNLKVIGVTGTNGKTTSVSMLRHILCAAGMSVCEIGTLGIRVWKGASLIWSEETGFTTPEAPSLHHFFSQLVAKGIDFVVMEVSSHASILGRVSGIEFDSMIFTNLSREHLDFHKSMESYLEAKSLLFTRHLLQPFASAEFGAGNTKRPWAILNGDDLSAATIVSKLPRDLDCFIFRKNVDYKILTQSINGLELSILNSKLNSWTPCKLSVFGTYNAENTMGCIRALHLSEFLSEATVLERARSFMGAPGRLEKVSPRVFVDFAHSPDALEKVLELLKSLLPSQDKLHVVFGCGGDRDAGKRPLMGKVAASLADFVYITSDNPRTEKALTIIEQIRDGVDDSNLHKVSVIESRKEAILKCLSSMGSGDIAVVAGKGHENYQIIGHEKFSFSDAEVIKSILT